MKVGDHSGFVALQSNYGTVGVAMEEDGAYIEMVTKDGVQEKKKLEGKDVYLKVFFDFEDSIDMAEFFYSLDSENWTKLGVSLKMLYTLDHFMGYRIGLYNYATKELGGKADFEYFKYEF